MVIGVFAVKTFFRVLFNHLFVDSIGGLFLSLFIFLLQTGQVLHHFLVLHEEVFDDILAVSVLPLQLLYLSLLLQSQSLFHSLSLTLLLLLPLSNYYTITHYSN